MWLNGAFGRYLTQCFFKMILLKKSEIKVSERSILTLFDTMFWKLVLLKESEIKVAKRCLLTLFETTFFGS